MTREEYLNQMQSYRQELQENCDNNREAFDRLAEHHREVLQEEDVRYKSAIKLQRTIHSNGQRAIERKMHELKVQWAKEHPIEEVKVVNND